MQSSAGVEACLWGVLGILEFRCDVREQEMRSNHQSLSIIKYNVLTGGRYGRVGRLSEEELILR